MNVSHPRHTIATRPQLLSPAGRFWVGYAIALTLLLAWWLS